MLRQSLLHSLWGMCVLYGAHSESVVADHRFIGQPYIGLRSSAVLIVEGVLLEKAIERFLSTVECINGVMRLKLFDAPRQRFS